MNYVVKNLQGLADVFHAFAANAIHGVAANKTDLECQRATRAAYQFCAKVVEQTIIEDMPVQEEYRIEYENAVSCAASQVWASMQRHKGDPCWEYAGGSWTLHGEVRT